MGALISHNQKSIKSNDELEQDILSINKITTNPLFNKKTGYEITFSLNQNIFCVILLSRININYKIVI
jgi:hypothetical protein